MYLVLRTSIVAEGKQLFELRLCGDGGDESSCDCFMLDTNECSCFVVWSGASEGELIPVDSLTPFLSPHG